MTIIFIDQFKKEKRHKMIAVIVILTIILSTFIWNIYIQNQWINDFNIPPSKNLTHKNAAAIIPSDINRLIDENSGKPILLYLYTSWCSACKKQTPIINEISREFQETDLQVISVAIDKNLSEKSLIDFLSNYKNIFFKPYFLVYSDSLKELLKNKGISYKNIIPFTVIIDREGNIVKSFNGKKNNIYLKKQIIKTLGS